MPPRPFPYPLSIGTDIASLSRVRRLLIGRDEDVSKWDSRLARYMRRFLTYREQRQFWGRFDNEKGISSSPARHDSMVRYLAGRWAAKEAVVKAVHWRRLSFKHIQILQRDGTANSGPLYALILDHPASSLATDAKVDSEEYDEQHNLQQPVASKDGMAIDTFPILAKNLQFGTTTYFTPAEAQNDDLDGAIAQISISHDGDYATAVCLAAEEPKAGDVGGEAAARGM